MSNTYLDRFRSSLPTTQGNQILKLLISKRDSGEIKNIDEFKDKLKQLTTELLAKRITPMLKIFEAIPGADTSSAQYNEMLDRIRDDLETAFKEADNLDDIITAHNNLINDISLKALRFGINELESKISLYEFLNKSKHGFDSAMFNTFRGSLNYSTSRTNSASSVVYFDPRKLDSINSDEDAEVDLIGERLILGPANKKYLPIKTVTWLSNSNSVRSEMNVAFLNSKITNIIDGKNNTYWVEPILLRSISNTGVPMEIAFHMNASQDINFIEIEPASNYPITFIGIDYFDSNNQRQSTSATELILYGPTRINFSRITTRCIVLRIKQCNYSEIQFKQKPGESNFHRAVLGESLQTVDKDSVSEDLNDLLTSDFILTDVMKANIPYMTSVKYYEYLLGFDNVRIGYSTFQERSIFVSEVKRVENPGVLGLRISEVRPVQNSGETSIELQSYSYPAIDSEETAKFYHSSVEYWSLIQFFTEDDYLISTDIIPVLPLGAKRIYHERLVLYRQENGSINPNISQLMFYTEADENDVIVYRNGTQLTYGSDEDWEFVTEEETYGLTVTIPGAGLPVKRAIKLKSVVSTLDIYTVSYTPVTSNIHALSTSDVALAKVVDLIGDNSARLVNDNIIIFGDTRKSQKIAYINLYLLIIMRRNSAIENTSPAVEEYLVTVGSKNNEKFLGEQ